MAPDYSFFIQISENGSIWWELDDAIKLATGYLPTSNVDPKEIHILRSPSHTVLVNHRKLIGAKNYDYPNVTRPRIIKRENYQYVEAMEFLGWFAQYLAHTKTNIPFPDELARQIEAEVNSSSIESAQQFESLATILKGCFRSRLNKLSENQRVRVERDLYPLEWDEMSPKQRRTAAIEWDQQHETAVAQDRQFWVNYYLQREAINRRLTSWESISTNSATELAQQEIKIAELKKQLRELDRQKSQHNTIHDQSKNRAIRNHQENTNNEVDRKENKRLTTSSYHDCLPGLPLRQDYWQLVIVDAVRKFTSEHGHCPHEAEVWSLLCSDSLPEYMISLHKDRGEISISSMGEKPLGKRSFKGRWKRYTTTK